MGPFTRWRPPGPGAGCPEELAWMFSMAAKLSGACSKPGEWSPSLDFSSSPAGRSKEGVGGPRTLAGECAECARRFYLPQERAEEGGRPRGGARGEALCSRRKPVCSRAGGAQSVTPWFPALPAAARARRRGPVGSGAAHPREPAHHTRLTLCPSHKPGTCTR